MNGLSVFGKVGTLVDDVRRPVDIQSRVQYATRRVSRSHLIRIVLKKKETQQMDILDEMVEIPMALVADR